MYIALHFYATISNAGDNVYIIIYLTLMPKEDIFTGIKARSLSPNIGV